MSRAVWWTSLALVLGAVGPVAAQEEPRVEPAFGGVVDARVPAVVRVPGADRVRGARGPWCLPVAPGSAEFVLPVPPLPGTALTVEIGERVVEVYPAWRTVAPPLTLVVEGADAALAPGATTLRASVNELTTVSTPYRMFDTIHAPEGLEASFLSAITRTRIEGSEPARRLDPAAWEPELAPFRAVVAEAGLAAELPPGVVTLWLLLGGLQLALIGWVRWQRPDRRMALVVLAVPGIATACWLTFTGQVDGRVRARVACYSVDEVATILLHVSADQPAELRVDPPTGAGVAHPVRYDVDDESWRDASVGRDVRLALDAGESRLLAYRVLGVPRGLESSGPPPRDVDAWLRGLGLRATGETFDVPADWLPTLDGHPVVAAPGRRVEPGK